MMKQLLTLLSFVALFASCKPVHYVMGGNPKSPVVPFLVIKGQRDTIKAAEVVKRDTFIVADEKKYPITTVQTYANKQEQYMICPQATQPPAALTFTGKMDVYMSTFKYTTMTKNAYGGHNIEKNVSRSFYFKPADTAAILPLSYKYLSQYIPVGAPGYNYLSQYQKKRTAIRSLRWTSLGLTALGAIAAGITENQSNRPLELTGYGLLTAGMSGLIISVPLGTKNNGRIEKAIGAYNGIHYSDEKNSNK